MNFWGNIDRRGPYKNDENFVLYQNVLRKYFLSKLLFSLIKGSSSPQLKTTFGKLNFWLNIDRRGPYKNGENLKYLKLWQEKILSKLFVPLIKESVSPQFWAIFGKLNFWRNIEVADLRKMVKILYYLKMC